MTKENYMIINTKFNLLGMLEKFPKNLDYLAVAE